MIPQSFVQDLLARVDIVDVIERALPLKRSGANYFACCPFHKEKSASFTVSPAKQFYHCFGCGAHGSAIGFLMEHGNLSFPDAVEDLARQVGLTVPKDDRAGSSRAEADLRDKLFEAVATVASHYQSEAANPKAQAYLETRGVLPETVETFGLGYAPAKANTLAGLFGEYPSKTLEDAGLITIDEKSGRVRDFFFDRLMFPIHDARGRVIAFGGRSFGDAQPKYLNSRETPLFDKGRNLYGLHLARRAIQDRGLALVVEGYMDVVMLAQHGVKYAVATLGTATTGHHLEILFRITDTVVFCFDGDAAGEKAAWRAMENALGLIEDGKSVRFMFLPTGDDPDSYVRAHGREAFETMLRSDSRPLSAFMLKRLASDVDMDSSEGRARLATLATPYIAKLKGEAIRALLTKELARVTGLNDIEVARGVDRVASLAQDARAESHPVRQRERVVASLDRRIAGMLSCQPEWVTDLGFEIMPKEGDIDRRLLLAVIEYAKESRTGSIGGMTEYFRGHDLESSIATLAAEYMSADAVSHDEYADGLFGLYDSERKRRLEALSEKADREGLSADELRLFRELSRRAPR